jgi:hypothetical protein
MPRRVRGLSDIRVRINDGCEDSGGSRLPLRHVPWVRLKRVGVQIGSAVETAAQRRLGYRFHMPRAPPHAG